MKADIRGLPVFSGEVLSPDSPVLASLDSIEDFVGFAKKLRGQFSIIVERGSKTVAITDFGGSRPVFRLVDPAGGGYRLGTRLADLIPFSRKRMSKEALFFYASRSGVGVSPFYSDIRALFPATVTTFEGDRIDSRPYLDWGEFLETRPIEPAAAERCFIEIASGYLSAIAKARGPIACLLSGGTDSALIAWLLRKLGIDSLNLTADYAWKRYSEFDGAAASARALGVRHERVLVTSGSRREAFLEINAAFQNAPGSSAQSPVMHALAKHARKAGISTLATGDHADALFLGFDRFFRGLPGNAADYAQAIAGLDVPGKMTRLYSPPQRTTAHDELLSAFGCTEGERHAWDERIYADDCREMRPWAERAPLDVLQQLSGQIWGGVSWQNVFLPVTQAFAGEAEFISPFYDIEMIRFAMSLPAAYKFRGGATKVLLRDILERAIGRSIVKRASPNPARIWRLAPDFSERRLQPHFLLPLYDRLFRRNLLSRGALWSQLDQVAALGLWLHGQPLDTSARPE